MTPGMERRPGGNRATQEAGRPALSIPPGGVIVRVRDVGVVLVAMLPVLSDHLLPVWRWLQW